MADLTRLVDSADCATHGCPNEADRADGLCRMCRTVPSRRTLLAPQPGALAHLADQEDTPVPAPSLVKCVVCGKVATHNITQKKGYYARLCDQHYDERRARLTKARTSTKTPASVKAPPQPEPRPDTAPVGTTTPAVTGVAEAGHSSLAVLAVNVDNAKQRLDDAQHDYRAALERLRTAVQELAA